MDHMLTRFFTDWSPVAVVAKLFWLVQLGLIVHVLKTGRPYWWLWLLFIAPLIGGVAYALIELVPNLRAPDRSFSWKPRLWRIRDLKSQVEETDTVKLRLTLAEELLVTNQPAEACRMAEACLTGIWRNDPHTLASVAHYRLEADQSRAALDALEKVDVAHDRMLAADVALMRGRALVAVGRHAEAQEALRAIVGTYIGEEPRYFLALSLLGTGRRDVAREIWLEIRKRFRRAGRGWRRTEKRWFKLATERLKESKSA
jgi:hypothetical protein